MLKKLIFLSMILCVMGCEIQKLEKEAVKKTPLVIPANVNARPLLFKKMIVKLERGTEIGKIYGGEFCAEAGPFRWSGGRADLMDEEMYKVVRDEFEKANYPIVGNPDALFEDPSEWKAELVVGGLVKDMKINICFPLAGFGNYHTSKGNSYVKVDWQIYSRLDRRVIYEVSTEGSFVTEVDINDGDSEIILRSFAVATQNLLADEGFYKLVTRGESKTQNTGMEELAVTGREEFKTPIVNSIDQVHASTVTIFAGDGHGSGFFINQNGDLLTNEHVVREAEKVTIKLASGKELTGRVVRTESRRDIALVKVADADAMDLPIRLSPAVMSEEVYTLGTPLNEKFEGTLCKGIVSGFREDDGLQFIQSDVNVLPGNSGGPLLDSNGNVIGIASSAYFIGDAPAGITFFIPIKSALEAIHIQYSNQ